MEGCILPEDQESFDTPMCECRAVVYLNTKSHLTLPSVNG